MAAKAARGLGKGLDTLIPNNVVNTKKDKAVAEGCGRRPGEAFAGGDRYSQFDITDTGQHTALALHQGVLATDGDGRKSPYRRGGAQAYGVVWRP